MPKENKEKNLFENFACEWFKHKDGSVHKGKLFEVYKRFFYLKKKYKYKEIEDCKVVSEIEQLKKEISEMENEYNFPRFANIERTREYFRELSETQIKKPQKYLHGTLQETLRAINNPPKSCPDRDREI